MQSMKCPRCGQQMLEGWMVSGGYHFSLLWSPKHKKPKGWDFLPFSFPFNKRGNAEMGMMLHPHTNSERYLPAMNCIGCKLVVLDYDEEKAE